MIDDNNMADEAVRLFDNGFHCSQAVLSVCSELFDIENVDMAVAAVSPFGGGLASTGSVCGCLTGALAVLGLAMGKKTPEEKDGRDMWRMGYRLVKEFEAMTAEYGSINCRDISGINWKDRDAVKAFRNNENGKREPCHRVLAGTVEIVKRLAVE